MAAERVSRGVKLSATTIVSTDALVPPKEVSRLRKYVSRVEYKLDDVLPEWDAMY